MSATVNRPELDLSIEAGTWPGDAELHDLVERVVGMACDHLALELVPGTELSLVFTDDAHVRELNGEWRGKDTATNVLSFPGGDETEPPFGPLLGDLVFAEETVTREAGDLEIAFSDHLSHLVVHGFLHLLGYDHQMEDEAEEMEETERRILSQLGIADPYREPPLTNGNTESNTPV